MRFSSLYGIKKIKQNSFWSGIIISTGIFLVVLFLFTAAIARTSESSAARQRENLESVVNRCLLQSYVTEGRYPETFDMLQQKYGIIYDQKKYRIDYIVYGSNMRPDVTIIELEGVD